VFQGRAVAQTVSRRLLPRGGLGSSPGQFVWNLWCTKWHWDRSFSKYFDCQVSVSFHQCSIPFFIYTPLLP